MKLFIKILAGVLLFFLLFIIGLNIYFTDDRLKDMIVPHINETLEREVRIDRLSLTFFKTFPRFGLQMDGFILPDDEGEPVAALESLIAAVRILPLLRDEISISQLEADGAQIYYRINADSTTNIDFLLGDDTIEPDDRETGYTIQIPNFIIRNAGIFYTDATTDTRIDMAGLNAEIGLEFADQIESSVDARLESLSAFHEGTEYLNNLALQLQQESVIDMDRELLTITEGTFSIRGLALNLTGTFGNWSSDSLEIDLQFNSASDNFAELLGLAPPEFDEHLQELETRGSLTLEGFINGSITEDHIPNFEINAEVAGGYLNNPDIQEPIQNIQFSLLATNELITINRFTATASGNAIEASGNLERPFEEDAVFSFGINGDIDLQTISQFYPIDQAGVETLSGLLAIDADVAGNLGNPEAATFNGEMILGNGVFKYIDVPRAFENIEVNIEAIENRIVINNASFSASSNRFSMAGSITEPLAEMPTFDLTGDLEFDLGTLKEFYPIDEDTLTLRGSLIAQATFRGQANQIERALQQSNIELRNGYIDHRLVGNPLEDITFMANASSTQLNISEARFITVENTLSLSGVIDDYMEDDPLFNLTIDGTATLADVSSYYPLEPWINELSGNAVMNLNARGPAGEPLKIALNGSLSLEEVSAIGDSLALPVDNLRGELSVRPDAMSLESFFMNYGSSDFSLEGSLQNYLGFLQDHESEATMPSINGTYHSQMLNMDEMFDWNEETTEEEPLLIELPHMTSTVTARIDTLMLFGVPIINISGNGRTTHEQIVIEEATAEMFEGAAGGRMVWNVPQPDVTNLRFTGDLNDLQVNAFFSEFPVLGENSRFEQFVTGGFSANVDYYTELDEFIDPDITTTTAEGSFGMSRARLQNHPLQVRLAGWLGADELRNLALDEWEASFTIDESVLTLNDFRLTSENIGIELDGTQHLITDEIDFTAQLLLPSRFRNGIASVITGRAVDAMTRDDGIIIVPIRITGTMENPQISPRQTIIEDLLRDTGRDVLRGLFDRN